jgi:hypothetical protein
MSKATGATGGIAGLGAIGFGVYGIGQVHGFVNMTIFIVGAIISLFIVYRLSGSRKKKNECIVYNQNEVFMVAVLALIITSGLYSAFRIYQKQNELGESMTGDAIGIVFIFAIIFPGLYAFSILKNRNDKIIITPNNLKIVDNNTTHEFLFEDLDSYEIANSKLVLYFKEKDKITFKLDELNLNAKDIKLLDLDLKASVIKR